MTLRRRIGADGVRRSQGGSRKIWYPTALENLAAYYDVDVITVGAADKVTNWPDQSGQGNNLAQATDSKRPTYVLDGDGKYAVNFDRTLVQQVSKASTTANRADELSIAAWIYPSSANTGGNGSLVSQYGFSAGQSRLTFRATSDFSMVLGAATNRFERYGLGFNTWRHYAFVYRGSGGSANADKCAFYVNGTLEPAGAYVGTIPATLPNTFTELAIGSIPQAGSTTSSFSGRVDQITIVNRAITLAEVTRLRWYRPRGS